MQKCFLAFNLCKNTLSAHAKKYSSNLKGGQVTMLSNGKNTWTRYNISLLLSVYGLYMTKETFCSDQTLPADQHAQLYSWGGNQYGQLGLGSDVTKPFPERVEALENIDISAISAKSALSAALSRDGRIFTWGSGKTGALGHSNARSTNVSLPALVESVADQSFTQIGCGKYHMAAINQNGQLYTWGNQDHGVLGREIKSTMGSSKKTYNPKTLLDSVIQLPGLVEGELKEKKCIQVACGIKHTIVLTSANEVYSWGGHRSGALGYVANQDTPSPQKIEFFNDKKVVKIAAGSDFNYALTQDGKMYAWGNNYSGQLGISSGDSSEIPSYVTALYGVKIVDVTCGDNFGAAISDKGKLYTWGYGNEGQLGHGSKNDLKAPKMLEFNKKIASVDCGSSHAGFVTTDGELYMFGRGREGQLGRADLLESSVSYRVTPQKVEHLKGKKVVAVSCGGDHTLALVQ